MRHANFVCICLTLGFTFTISTISDSKPKSGGAKISSALKGPAISELPTYTLMPTLVIPKHDDSDSTFLFRPRDVSVDVVGNIFILDAGNKRVVKFDKDGRYLQQFGRMGQGPGEFRDPFVMDINLKTELLYVFDGGGNNRVEVFDLMGEYKKSFRVSPVRFPTPLSSELVIDNTGNIIMINFSKNSIFTVLSPQFNEIATFGVPPEIEDIQDKSMDYVAHIDVTPQGELFVVYRFHPILQKYDDKYGLLFTKTLHNKDIQRLLDNQRKKSRVKRSEGGLRFSFYIKAIVADNSGGCYISIIKNLYHFNNAGEQQRIIELKDSDSKNITAFSLFIDNSNNLYAVSPFDMKLYRFSLAELPNTVSFK